MPLTFQRHGGIHHQPLCATCSLNETECHVRSVVITLALSLSRDQ